jgi:hypothetical protein
MESLPAHHTAARARARQLRVAARTRFISGMVTGFVGGYLSTTAGQSSHSRVASLDLAVADLRARRMIIPQEAYRSEPVAQAKEEHETAPPRATTALSEEKSNGSAEAAAKLSSAQPRVVLLNPGTVDAPSSKPTSSAPARPDVARSDARQERGRQEKRDQRGVTDASDGGSSARRVRERRERDEQPRKQKDTRAGCVLFFC